jgi:D-alanyl-D-alanine carboxypeptidase
VKALVAVALCLPLIAGCSAAATTASSTADLARAKHSTDAPSATPRRTRAPFDRHSHSLTDPNSVWVVVNKRHPISPLTFEPQITLVRGYQVASSAAAPLSRMLDAADRAGVHLKIASAYRSYGYQEGVHSHLVATIGQAAADAVSARPGYSEHQTGLAVDLQPLDGTCALQACFAHTAEDRWLVAHSWQYGFVVRYTAANREVTGYSPEPWHFRYVGTALARELRRTRTGSLEQFFGLKGGVYPASTTP